MKYITIIIVGLLIMLFACARVPITGRKQLSFVPESQVLSMSLQQYSDFLKTSKLSDNKQQTQMVKTVGSRIADAVGRYFAQNNMSNQLKDYKWEFNLVQDSQINAWCMPGGKVVVYTGIMPVVQNEDGLAVVLGHEISHAVANHGDERMSQQLLTQFGGAALSVALQKQPEKTQQIFLASYGVGSQVGILLPYSRVQESEADHLGLIFMAMAGYDPHGALDFWQRMMNSQKGSSPPAFLSDHPSDETRLNKIEELMPEAMQYYNKR
jgi:predicted Zn-dependent protease